MNKSKFIELHRISSDIYTVYSELRIVDGITRITCIHTAATNVIGLVVIYILSTQS